MSIILFATLSVPALGGAESLREAAPRVPAHTTHSCLYRTVTIPPPYFHNPEPQGQAVIRCSPHLQQQQRKLRPREINACLCPWTQTSMFLRGFTVQGMKQKVLRNNTLLVPLSPNQTHRP